MMEKMIPSAWFCCPSGWLLHILVSFNSGSAAESYLVWYCITLDWIREDFWALAEVCILPSAVLVLNAVVLLIY